MKKIAWTIFGVATAAAVVYGIRSCVSGPEDFMVHQVSALRQRTVPVDSVGLHVSEITRTRFAAEVSWEFQTGLKWAEYGERVKKELSSDFRSTGNSGNTLEFGRQLNADAQSLRIERVPDGDRIRVIFRSQPD